MSDKFYYLSYDVKTINDKSFICVNILNLSKNTIHKIYKPFSDKLKNTISLNKTFSDISDLITFNIKRDGKITLDIKNL